MHRDIRRPIGRREFLAGSMGSLIAAGACRFVPASDQAGGWDPSRKVLFVSVDGFGPEYLTLSDMPNLKAMIASGIYVEGADVIPSVTNVNNASIVTGSFPSEHGITGNYYYDPSTRAGTFMESPEFLLRPTIFERARSSGIRSAFVTSKEKLMFLSRGADFAVAAENPDAESAAILGAAQDVYSADINYWSLRAARHYLNEGECQLVYVATTDYMMHTYPPEDERSQAHLHTVDEILGQILDDHGSLEVYLTADHGMSAKTDAIDINRLMRDNTIEGEAVPIIRDRYVQHHANLGGACYVYLQNPLDLERAHDLLKALPGVEEIHLRADAAQQFQLQADRIGDIFLLGAKDVVFGDLEHPREEVAIRSHGSRHESTVPIVAYGRAFDASSYQRNIDLTRNFEWET
jgi:phosphonoacetate hydrolase